MSLWLVCTLVTRTYRVGWLVYFEGIRHKTFHIYNELRFVMFFFSFFLILFPLYFHQKSMSIDLGIFVIGFWFWYSKKFAKQRIHANRFRTFLLVAINLIELELIKCCLLSFRFFLSRSPSLSELSEEINKSESKWITNKCQPWLIWRIKLLNYWIF